MAKDKKLVDSLVSLIAKAECDLPKDVETALKQAYKEETAEIAKAQLAEILRNIRIARRKNVPMCQDTGSLNFYVRIGEGSTRSRKEVAEAIEAAAKTATKTVPLRPNSVDPLSRKNTGGTVPSIEFAEAGGKSVEITVAPKGAGSDNMTRLCMLSPSSGVEGLKRFVLESVASAGGKVCPPAVVGVGIGGSSDVCLHMAKKALLRKIGERNQDKKLAALEKELEEDINGLGVGPMGLGGKVSCLAVHIESAPCHTGSLPAAVSLGCWATRRATARI